MKAIMVMFDSLNRHMLPPYGCESTHAPNFRRLAERSVTFERSYVCSMPCMPARRDLHTGRPNFLHRCWGPLEPFDDSVPQMLKDNGIYTHIDTDHHHYFEDGGATYHTRYNSWQFFRGQEGDPFIGQVADPPVPERVVTREGYPQLRADWVNRKYMKREQDQPQPQTFRAGLEFIRRNHRQDNWFLQIETFDPHEPFFTQRKYKDLYPQEYDGPLIDWPPYCEVTQPPDQVQHCRNNYMALLSMCDAYLGDVLDVMDELDLWEDTMLIVWTDHGFLLGEHGCWAKIWPPFYEEIAHTPFFVWDPRCGKAGERRRSLVQPSIDIPLTLLDFFGVEPTPDMLGKSLTRAIADDTPVREAAIFGLHGRRTNVTDGRYVYMRAPANPENAPLFEYTLVPTRMRGFMRHELFRNAELAEPFSFTKGCRVLRLDRGEGTPAQVPPEGHLLYDLQENPSQEHPIEDAKIERRMIEHMLRLMRECDAPAEQYERMGLLNP